MTHYATKNPGVTSGIRTPGDWLPIGAQIGRLVNEWSARSDLAVVLNSTTSGGHPALYDPRQSEIEISTHQPLALLSSQSKSARSRLASSNYSGQLLSALSSTRLRTLDSHDSHLRLLRLLWNQSSSMLWCCSRKVVSRLTG